MKLAFDFICDEALLFSNVALLFQKEGADIYGFSMGRRWNEGWSEGFAISPACDINRDNIDFEKELERINREYRDYYPGGFLHADRFLVYEDKQEQLNFIVRTFLTVEECLNKWRPDFYFSTGVAYMYNLVTMAVCGKLNIPHVSLYSTRAAQPRFTISFAKGGSWDLVENQFQSFKRGEICAQNEIEDAASELDDFRNNSASPFYMNMARQSSSLKLIFIKEFFNRCWRWYMDNWKNQADDYITKSPFWYAWRDTKKLILAAYIKRKKQNIYHAVDKSDNYYIYPLHLQPEASTLVLSPWYVNQLAAIENIAKTLPLGHFLYVKEHRSALGRHSLSFYKALKKIHNVKLIAYDEHVPGLIRKSKGVIVLSSTMGWEALKLGKPVYLLGDVFYKIVDGVHSINSMEQLQESLNKMEEENSLVVDDELLKKFIISIKRCSYPGVFDVHKLDSKDKVLSEENIKNVKNGIAVVIDSCMETRKLA